MQGTPEPEPAWSKGLKGPALAIASSDDDRLRVLAGPGTGKTFALQRLAMRLLETHDPHRILVVTFTRTAGADLSKVMKKLEVPGCEDIIAGTLHSLCFRILTSNAALEAHNRTPRTVISVKKGGGFLGFEFDPMLRDLGANPAFGEIRDRIKLIRAYEAAWARQQHQAAGATPTGVDQQFEAALVDWLIFHAAMLIGELIPETLKYLQANPRAPELTQFDRVIVDEYQDLNKAEQTILDLLARNGKLAIVGDEDQSIYAFRHANPEGIADFSNRHAGTVDETLVQCRRCAHSIVDAANSLIGFNHIGSKPPFKGMDYDPSRPQGEIHVVQWDRLTDEVAGIAEYINHLITSKRYGAGDILVMTPRRRIGYQIRNAIRHHGIEAHSFFHEEALEEDAAQLAFTLLVLLANNQDRVALRFWLGFEGEQWRTEEYTKLRAYCDASGDSLWDALEKMNAGTFSAADYPELLARFQLLKTQLAPLAGLTDWALIDALFPQGVDWSDAVREMLAGTTIDILTDADALAKLVRDYVTQPEIPVEPNFVRIMSLHASKGLTAEVAIVTTVVDSLVPTLSATLTGDERRAATQEQRRVFYVAITRGRDVLVLSSPAAILPVRQAHAMRVRVTDRTGRTFASTFLGELGLPPDLPKSGDDWKAAGYTS